MKSRVLAFLCAALSAGALHADIRLAKIFTNHMVIQQDLPIRIFGWADANEKVTVEFNSKSNSTTADAQGKWRVELPAMKSDGSPKTLVIKGKNTIELTDILLGEVWLAVGQSNMSRGLRFVKDRAKSEPMNQPNLRLFFVGLDQVPQIDEPKITKGWEAASHQAMTTTFVHPTAGPYEFSEVTYYFGKTLQEKLGVPVGMISAAFPGSTVAQWTPAENPGTRFDFATGKSDTGPGAMYQSMLQGLPPFSIRGAIYYQGENDAKNEHYDADLKKLIESWRAKFERPDMPFYMTEIAQTTFMGGMLRVTEAQQRITEQVPHTALASSNDLWDGGNPEKAKAKTDKVTGWPIVGGGDPHPPNKNVVAGRLARIALSESYGRNEGETQGPMIASFEPRGETLIITFNHAGKGLKTDDDTAPNWFEISSDEKQFVKADAKIVGPNTVELKADGVKNPKAYRFSWNALARHNLYNSEGLAAIRHRSESTTAKK